MVDLQGLDSKELALIILASIDKINNDSMRAYRSAVCFEHIDNERSAFMCGSRAGLAQALVIIKGQIEQAKKKGVEDCNRLQ